MCVDVDIQNRFCVFKNPSNSYLINVSIDKHANTNLKLKST